MGLSCASGCLDRGLHVGACLGDCSGCLPRSAEVGLLCRWCFQRLAGAVVDLPVVVAHLHEVAEPSLSSPLGNESAGGGVARSRVLYSPALDAADDLAGVLGTWVDEIIAEHPGRLRGPSDLGWRFSRPTRQVDPVTGVAYLPTEHRLGATVDAVRSMGRWVLPHLSWISRQSWAPDMLRELASAVATAKARWPLEEREHRVPMPCPRCGHRSLAYWPPREPGDVAVVACDLESCAQVWVEDAWTRVVEIVLAKPDVVREVEGAGA